MADNDDTQFPSRPQSTSLSLGERLRSARKARALSIEQMADALRLEEASVEALEEGRFDELGAPVFVRGHLKRYAAMVGLGTEAVLDAYRAAAPGSDAPPSISRPRVHLETVAVPSWVWWLLAAVVVIAAVFAFSGGEPEPAAGVSPGLSAPLPEPVQAIPAPLAAPGGAVVTELPAPVPAPAPATPDVSPAPEAVAPAPESTND